MAAESSHTPHSTTSTGPGPGGGSSGAGASDFHSVPQFPHHVGPRTWLIVAGASNTGTRLARLALAHGDHVVLGVPPASYDELHAATAAANAGVTPQQQQEGSLDTPFARLESELVRQLLLELDELYAAADVAADAMMSGDDIDDYMGPATPRTGDTGHGPAAGTPATATTVGAGSAGGAAPARRRLRPVRLDPKAASQCQGAVATAVAAFGGVDILVCNSSQVVIGAVEELGASDETLALVRDQFETNFFSNVNAIKAVIPAMRDSGKGGHVVVMTGITGHLGTPGLGAFCAAGWALEGYCDSIAYEVAPFNIKVSIVQPMLETAVLPNLIKAAPALSEYAPGTNRAPLSRNVIGGLLDRIHGSDQSQQQSHEHDERRGSAATDQTSGSDDVRSASKSLGSSTGISMHEPRLPPELLDGLIHETLFSICAIAGHPNPPQRHIVGQEGVISVKEKLKTVSMELEDLVQASAAVDVVVEGE